MTPIAFLALIGLIGAALVQLIKRLRRSSISHVPGPRGGSVIFGHLIEIAQGQAAEAELKWKEEFGDVYRTKGFLGEDRLHISDPKGVQYIFQTSGYNFFKPTERREISRLVSGKGILWADGDNHKRQRKVLLPGFSGPDVKRFLPVLLSHAAKMVEKWKDVIASNGGDMGYINIPSWASRCTLDAIGEVAFDYQFGTLDNNNNALGQAYASILLHTFGTLTKHQILFANIMMCMPEFVREFVGDHIKSKKLFHAQKAATLSTEVSKKLIKQKSEFLLQGKGSRDIMTLLVRANASEKENARLSDEEMLGMMRVVIFAGHETTANTLTWALLELSRRPDLQAKLRQEIRGVEQAFSARGDSQCTTADLDSMPYLNAVLKETLRYHPVIISLMRQAAKNHVIPLSRPVTTSSGDVITELPVEKGQMVITSISAYNRNKDIFGEDADVFDPERWLDSRVKKTASVGVMGNLFTFSGGIRACVGWKFAVIQLQAFLFELLGKFEFVATPESRDTRREAAAIAMVPTLPGQVHKGSQLKLGIRAVVIEESLSS